MVRDLRDVPNIQGTGKKEVSETEWITRRKYHVSMASVAAIPAGAVLSEEMITWRNPGTGIPSKLAHTVLGKRAKRDIPVDELLSLNMFE
jgi:sialic acid synthase SpsE